MRTGGEYAFMPDGQRVLLINATGTMRPISLVFNWAGGSAR
jgi:hypothetical protein